MYDSVDEDVLRSFHEISLANMIFFAMKEGACSELSSRMTAMDGASKNAGKHSNHLHTVNTMFLPYICCIVVIKYYKCS